MAKRWLLLIFTALNLQAQGLLKSGLQALQSGNLTQARTDLEQASKADPRNAIVLSALAEVYLRSHELVLAAKAAQSAENIAGGNPLVSHALAMYYSEAGDFAKAAGLEKRFAASPQADRNAAARAAGFYLQAKDPESALPLASQAAQTDPQTAFVLAQAFLKQQDFTPAATVLESALMKFPIDPQLVLALGVARYGQRRFEDAIDLFLRVINLDPSIDQPYSFIGRMLDQAGPRLPRIGEIFAQRAKEHPDDAQAQFLLAKVLLTADNKDPKAEPLLRRSVALQGDRWESHYELGALLAAKHNYMEAAAELNRSVQLNPNQPNTHYQLARVYDRLGKPDKAKAEREIHQRLTAPRGSGMQ